MNLINKTKSQFKFSLPFLIFCLGLAVPVLFLYQKQFYCYTFDKEFLLTSLNISMDKLSLNFLVQIQSTFTYIKVFNYDSFNLNQISLIWSGDVELNPDTKKSSSLTFFHWSANETAAHNFEKISLIQFCESLYDTDIIFLSETSLDSWIKININVRIKFIAFCMARRSGKN